jgi:hypothetical protein
MRFHRTRLPKPDDILAYAKLLYDGGLQSKTCNSPAKVAVRIAAGMEVGLSAVQSVNWITVINGRAVIWGDAVPALGWASGKLLSHDERFEGEGDDLAAVCTVHRQGDAAPYTVRFTTQMARDAKLLDKEGPWQDYRSRQLQMRARSWAFRDKFPDVLCGLGIAEEEMDVPVKVVKVETDKPTPPTPATALPELPAASAVTPAQLDAIALHRKAWLRSKGIDPEDKGAVNVVWLAKLAEFGEGVTSVKQLTAEQVAKLLADLNDLGHRQEVKEVFGENGEHVAGN